MRNWNEDVVDNETAKEIAFIVYLWGIEIITEKVCEAINAGL